MKTLPSGRMIRRDLADDEGMGRLSDGAARLYFMLYPHLDSHGKWCGGPGTIAETIIPMLRWSRKKILHYLVEINKHTSMNIWTHNQRVFVHDEAFSSRQRLNKDRMGRDNLPDFPGRERMKTGTSPNSLPDLLHDLLTHEVEVEVKEEVEVEVKEEVEVPPAASPDPLKGSAAAEGEDNGKGASNEVNENEEQKAVRKMLEQRMKDPPTW